MPENVLTSTVSDTERLVIPVLVIGIDPGAQTGYAVFDVLLSELTEARTMTFWEVVERAKELSPRLTYFVVEDPAQNRPVFLHGQPTAPQRERIAQNVGMNKREATLLIEGLHRLGFSVVRVKPTEEKWSSNMFRGVTGYDKRVSQHARDAARLCFGRKAWPLIELGP